MKETAARQITRVTGKCGEERGQVLRVHSMPGAVLVFSPLALMTSFGGSSEAPQIGKLTESDSVQDHDDQSHFLEGSCHHELDHQPVH